jgi:omega-6 fatty acid desaturase (delta-12 desaturase)
MTHGPSKAPPLAEVTHLKARDTTGAMYTFLCLGITVGGVALTQLDWLLPELSGWGRGVAWCLGHLLLAFGLLQWFVLLHECGHGVLFRSRSLNTWTGHLSGFFCMIPFRSWTAIHAMHHKWTGWQDLDPTTASLVPRKLGRGERRVMNFCWKYWVPAFSVMYRISNFWNPGQLAGVVRKRKARTVVAVNALVLAVIYGALLWQVGVVELFLALGPGAVLSLIMLDPIMLSQHTHIPLQHSGSKEVKAFIPRQQEVFTRSLRFPDWFSRVLLLHFDAHELHHIYPFVPGYCLREIDYTPGNETHWWRWIRMARKMPAEILLFQNRNDSGSEV